MTLEEFVGHCKQKGQICTQKQIDQFLQYATLLKEWNEKMNLTGITELPEVLEKHFYDSLIPFFELDPTSSLCDVGAGAGFPSLPLKILYPDLSVTILEPLKKRVVFLEEVIRQLGLEKIQCYNERAEEFAKEHRDSYDVVTARAVANLKILAELCVPLVKVGGCFVAMKGPAGLEEDRESTKAFLILGAKKEKSEVVNLQDGSVRINLTYRKEKKTPILYPRPFAKIKKSPL